MHQDAAREVAVAAAKLGMSIDTALTEKRDELRARLQLLSIPTELLHRERVPSFLAAVLGHPPSAEQLKAVRIRQREPRLSIDDRAILELNQLLRCALCGRRLRSSGSYHVDHIRPVVLGGRSVLDNFQLLCPECNAGKGALLDWIIGAQYQKAGETAQMRYCALARARGKCQREGCPETWRTSQLIVNQWISRADGGRWILDNLRARCEKHDRATQERLYAQATRRARSSRTPKHVRFQ
jgi:5-methylcytosine-specific restriction endonuclease McrA